MGNNIRYIWYTVTANTYSQHVLRQVPTIVDPPVHADEPLHGRLVLHVRVVQAGVQHDDSKRQYVTGVCKK